MSKALTKSVGIVGGMTLVSRILGFIRDVLVARVFGAGPEYDAFLAAFKIPNFMRALFAEGSFSQAFVPILSEYRTQRSHAEVQDFINKVAGTLSLVLFIVTLVAVIAAPVVIGLFTPGFLRGTGDRFDLATGMLRVTFPYLLFISLTAFCSGILNAYGRFGIPALTPVILNICMISAAIWLSPHFAHPVQALAWGVFLSGVLQLGFQLPFLRKAHLLPRPKIAFHDPGVRRLLRQMVPALFGVSVGQINLLIDTVFASFLKTGSMSWLYFADRLMQFPLGVFGIALATVVLPHLSRKHSEKSAQGFAETLDWAIRCVLLIGLPAAVGLYMLAPPLVVTLFQNKTIFTPYHVAMTIPCLQALAVGLLAFMSVKILAAGFYAQQDIKTPVKFGVFVLFLNTTLNFVLMHFFQHVGLAMATATSASINASLLFITLYKRGIYQPQKGWQLLLLRILLANFFMGVFLWSFIGAPATWQNITVWQRALHLAELIMGGAAVYLVSLWLSGLRLHHFKLSEAGA